MGTINTFDTMRTYRNRDAAMSMLEVTAVPYLIPQSDPAFTTLRGPVETEMQSCSHPCVTAVLYLGYHRCGQHALGAILHDVMQTCRNRDAAMFMLECNGSTLIATPLIRQQPHGMAAVIPSPMLSVLLCGKIWPDHSYKVVLWRRTWCHMTAVCVSGGRPTIGT